MELGTGSMTLCGLPRKDHAASGVRIRFVRRPLAVGKRGDRIAAFLNAALEANGNVALETDGPAALQAAPGDIAEAARSPRQQDRRGKRNRQGASKGVCGTGSGAHPHSAAYPHLAPSRPSAFGRLPASGLRPLIRVWRHHQGKKKGVSRISLAAYPCLAAGLQESPRTSPQFCRACLGRLGSDAHLRLAAGL